MRFPEHMEMGDGHEFCFDAALFDLDGTLVDSTEVVERFVG